MKIQTTDETLASLSILVSDHSSARPSKLETTELHPSLRTRLFCLCGCSLPGLVVLSAAAIEHSIAGRGRTQAWGADLAIVPPRIHVRMHTRVSADELRGEKALHFPLGMEESVKWRFDFDVLFAFLMRRDLRTQWRVLSLGAHNLVSPLF